MKQVRIASLALDPRTEQPVVILKPLDELPGTGVLLPIWIGQPEATAILLALEGVETSRPMTHELLTNVIQTMQHQLESVEITRVVEGTFFASLILRGDGGLRVVDARPSDSIALAVRAGAPIYVAEEVLTEAAVADESIPEDEEAEIRAFREFLEHVEPEDFSS